MPADLDAIATELYSLPLEEFTAARTKQEKAAKAAGDKDLAARIKALAKPNLTAWLANHLVRRKPDEVGALLELGPALREATATLSGEDLRHLGRQQRQLVNAIVRQAKALAAEAGRPISLEVTRGLEDTLHAALASEEDARVLLAGCLTHGLSHVGFSPSTGTAPRAKVPAREEEEDDNALREAERQRQEALEQARREEVAALEAVDTAAAEQAKASDELDTARATVAMLQGVLDTAEEALAAARSAAEEASARRADLET